ncbi:MAG TPA: DUF2784 domain-containing protein [Candidatus Acidoferrales bacterium]|nr:DUF2784 domain-containing protein [Candidatus Acidoferrales bacterium]
MKSGFYLVMADAVLIVHLAFIAWVIFGAFLTRGRPWLAWAHVITIVYGIIVETTPLVCPLTLAENWCETRAGVLAYRGPFLLECLDATVYPHVPVVLLVAVAVTVCVLNLGIYARRFLKHASLG